MKALIINPNSSQHMSDGVKKALDAHVDSLNLNVEVTVYTAPKTSPQSIDDAEDIEESSKAVQADLFPQLSFLQSFGMILIACFSVHPLVKAVDKYVNKGRSTRIPVTGIFEAAVLEADSAARRIALPSDDNQRVPRWGIVTTGKFWESHLTHGVAKNLTDSEDQSPSPHFAGVFSTGLNAGDFHNVDPDTVKQRLCKAVDRLLRVGNVQSIIMGCAGMAGLEDIIRNEAIKIYGDQGKDLHIVDGLKSGLTLLASEA
ncbi:hypothetical protein BROUX41_001789 [Berkeleyomyces rouxiae]|uniref:uncharacterized protein n=1 Tax=Berkeleyomyces rouxiae TaxID=2035830 RepID=UPI003B7CEB71